MKTLRVIGVGSPHEQDDLAWQAIDFLKLQFRGSDFEFMKLDRPGSQLIAHLDKAEKVVILDSLEQPAEESVVLLNTDQLQEENLLFSSHGFGVAEALQLASVMQLLPAKLYILGLSPGTRITVLAERCAAMLTTILSGEQDEAQNADVV